MTRRLLFVALLLVLAVRPASAQVLFDVGAVLIGSANAGSSTVGYTAPDGLLVPQFSIDKSIAAGLGVSGRLSFRVSSRVRLEVTGQWARPALQTKLSGDTDGADNATATQSIHRFEVSGGATAALKTFGKWHTFVRGSMGWLRELSDDTTLYQDGWVAKLGGGATYQWKEKQGRFRPYGIRTDVWLDIRHGGMEFSERPSLYAPACSVAMIFKL